MPNVGTATVTVVPSMRGFSSAMNKGLSGIGLDSAGRSLGSSLSSAIASSIDAGSISRGISSAFESAGGAISGVGTTISAGVTAALAGASVAVGKFALDVASAAETTEISFTTMLGGAEQAQKMMDELADFAAHTPFELSGLQDATRQLLAYGFAAEDVIPMLTAVGDATAALGTGQAGIEAVTRALGQMQTRGKVSAEEMLQLTEAGIPAWKYLAEAIGTDTAGAMEMVADGAVSASEGIAAVTDGMRNDFGGMMEEQSKTVEGLMSNLSDAIEQPLMQLRDTSGYSALAGALSNLVDSAGPLVESLLPGLDSGLSVVAGLLDSAAAAAEHFAGAAGQQELVSLAGAIASLGPTLVVAGGALSAMSPVIGAIGSAASAATSPLVSLGNAVGNGLGSAPSTLSSVASSASDMWTSLVGGARQTEDGLMVVPSLFSRIGSSAYQTASSIGVSAQAFAAIAREEGPVSALGAAFSGIGESVREVFPNISSAVQGAASAIGSFASGSLSVASRGVMSLAAVLSGSSLAFVAVATGIGVAAAAAATAGVDFASFGEGISAVITDAGAFATNLIQSVNTAIPAAVEGVSQAAPMIVNAIITQLSSIGEAGSQLLPAFSQLVMTIVPNLVQLFVQAAPMLLSGGLQLFSTLLTSLAQTVPLIAVQIPAFIQGIVSALVANIPSLILGAVQFFTAIAQAIPQVIPAIAAAIPQIANAICAQLPTAIPQLISAAVQLLISIVQAIPQVLPSVLSAVGSLIMNVVSNLPTYVGALLSAAVQLFLAIAESVPQVVGQVISAVGSLLSDIWDTITSFDLFGAAQQLIQGFINGIGSMVGSVVDAVGGAIGGAIDTAKSLLGIASPSRVFREIGDYTMQGMELGIKDGASGVTRLMDSVMGEVYGAASGGLEDIASSPAISTSYRVAQNPSDGVDRMVAALAGMGVYLDSGMLVGGISRDMDRSLGRIRRRATLA